jgi:hypothetical protein
MPRWKATQHLLGVRHDGEILLEDWADRDTLQMPPSPEWTGSRPIRFEDVDIWEVICEQSGLSGVYAAWCPYAEYYIVMDKWRIVEEFEGPHANARLERYLRRHGIAYPYVPSAG